MSDIKPINIADIKHGDCVLAWYSLDDDIPIVLQLDIVDGIKTWIGVHVDIDPPHNTIEPVKAYLIRRAREWERI